MKYYGIASPKVALYAISPIALFVLMAFGVIMGFGFDVVLLLLFACPFLIMLCVSVWISRNAFCPFVLDASGVRNHLCKLAWERVANIELVFTERRHRAGKYKVTSICIGEAAYGDICSQLPKKCIMMPYTQKNVERLRKLAAGKNPVIDQFLAAHAVWEN